MDGINTKVANCHPDRKLYCRGLCRPCYRINYECVRDHLCGCGCGQPARKGRIFIRGHWAKTNEGRGIRRESRIGKLASLETRTKMSESHRGQCVSDKTRNAVILRNKTGWQKSVADKISKTLTGRRLSEEHINSLKRSSKRGAEHKWWRGGKSEYPSGWDSVKREVRVRDDHFCLNCQKTHFRPNRAPDVHHIDGNKRNCGLSNLISLCRRCHVIAENNMQDWIPVLRSILSLRYGYIYD